jgi:hypothetical protein
MHTHVQLKNEAPARKRWAHKQKTSGSSTPGAAQQLNVEQRAIAHRTVSNANDRPTRFTATLKQTP